METVKRGLKRGLFGRKRTVILFLDTTWFNQIPPLRKAWSPQGSPLEVPIEGAIRHVGLTDVVNIRTGSIFQYGSEVYTHEEFEEILINVRSKWRGWNIILFLDKHSAQDRPQPRQFARKLGIELRFLPTACGELNIVDQLWKTVKGDLAANEPTPHVVETVRRVCAYIRSLPPKERLRKAGVFSEHFWLKELIK